jgi:GNAT superfamily N-acetyltransferase
MTDWKPLVPEHIAAVIDMERRAFTTEDPDFGVPTLGDCAWSAEDYIACLEEDATRGWGLFEGPVLVGVFIYELERGSYDVRRLLVHPDYRRAGFASLMLHRLYVRCLKNTKRRVITTHVDERNVEACRFFAHFNFVPTLARGHFGQDRDAVKFTFEVAEGAEEPEVAF